MTDEQIPAIEGEVADQSGRVPLSGTAGDRLRSFIERIERLTDEIKDIQADRREVKKECKNDGFDMDLVSEVLRRRAMDPAKRQKLDDLMPMYQAAIGDWSVGMVDGGDLGQPALPGPHTAKLTTKTAEADAWASGAIG